MAEEIIIEVNIDNAEAQKRAEKLTATIQAQRNELSAWRKVLRDSNGTNKEAAQEVSKLSRVVGENSKQLRIAQKEAGAEESSIDALRASVSKLTKERNATNTATAEGQKQFASLTAQISAQTAQLKELEGAVGDTRRNVGNYTESVKEAIQSSSFFRGSLDSLAPALDALEGGFGGLRTAILTLPFAAIIGAITTFLTQTRKGREILEVLGAVVKSVFGELLKVLERVGSSFIEFFNNPVENGKALLEDFADFITDQFTVRLNALVEQFGVLADILKAVFTGDFEKAKEASIEYLKVTAELVTGVEDIVDKVGEAGDAIAEFGEDIAEAAKRGADLAKQNQALRASIRALTVERAEEEKLAEQARRTRDLETTSFEDRLKAAQDVIEFEQERLVREKALANARLQILQNEIALTSEATDDQLQERADALAELEQLEADAAGRVSEAEREEAAIRLEQRAQFFQLERAQLEEQLIRLGEIEDKEGQERLDFLEKQQALRLAILGKEEEDALLGLVDGTTERLRVEQEFFNERLKILQEFAEEKKEIEETIATDAVQVSNVEADAVIKNETAKDEKKDDSLEQDRQRIQARQTIAQAELAFLNATLGAFKSFAGENEAAQKALFAIEKAVAIANVIVNLQKEKALIAVNSQSSVQSKLGGPLVGVAEARIANTLANIRAATSIATIVGQTIAGFAEGGFTGYGGKYEPAGIVHRGEVVFSQRDVQALGGPARVDSMRPTFKGARGYADGGIVGVGIQQDVNAQNQFNQIARTIASLDISVAVTDIQKAGRKYSKVQQIANQ